MWRRLLVIGLIASFSACSDLGSSGALTVDVIGDRNAITGPATSQGLVAFDADGQIEPALAERWIVSDDGLSLVFRLGRTTWANGKPVLASDVAASLKASFTSAPQGRLGHVFNAVDDVVSMTDRVIEIRLKEPRPFMLQLLAQPEFGVRHNGMGTGPYIVRKMGKGGTILRPLNNKDDADNPMPEELMLAREVVVHGGSAALGITRYTQGLSQGLLNGTMTDFPLVRAANISRAQQVIDPVNGLFGLAFAEHNPFTSDVTLRQALNMAVDRAALAQAVNLPNWQARETLLPARLDSAASPAAPDWSGFPMDARRAEALRRISNWQLHHKGAITLRVALPEGPGARLVFARIAADWLSVGVTAQAVGARDPADLKLIDEVAPSSSVNWYFTRLSCAAGLPCDQAADASLDAARDAATLDARARAYAQADQDYAGNTPFIILGSPFRWSLTSARLPGLRASPFGVHALSRLSASRN